MGDIHGKRVVTSGTPGPIAIAGCGGQNIKTLNRRSGRSVEFGSEKENELRIKVRKLNRSIVFTVVVICES